MKSTQEFLGMQFKIGVYIDRQYSGNQILIFTFLEMNKLFENFSKFLDF